VVLIASAIGLGGLGAAGLAYATQGQPQKSTAPQSSPSVEAPPPALQKDNPPNAKGKTEPAGVPLEARLVAKQDTYSLDLGGKTAEEFRKLLKDGQRPAPPQVDLVLEFHNTGDKEIKFLVGGTNPDIPLLLQLDGEGSMNFTLPSLASAMVSRPPEQITLAPGKSYEMPIKNLRTNNLGREGSASYWTAPGEYNLSATYQTAVSPLPKDAKESPTAKGFGMVTVTSNKVQIKVKDKDGKGVKEGDAAKNIECTENGKYIGGIDREWKVTIGGPKDKKWEYHHSTMMKEDVTAAGTYELIDDLAVFTGKVNDQECCFGLNYGFVEGKVHFNGFFGASDKELRLHRKWFKKGEGGWQPVEEVILTMPREGPAGAEWTVKLQGERTRWDKGRPVTDRFDAKLLYINLVGGASPDYSLKDPAEDWLPTGLTTRIINGRLEAVLCRAGTACGFSPHLKDLPGRR
jgi:hypothetical protein